MSNALTFKFENSPLTVLGDILNPLFIAKQVCELLGFGNPYQALKDHVDSDDVTKIEMTDRLNRKQLVNCVNESGLYALIFGSKLPKAKQFKKWVTSEVLPAIRKQGFYSAQKEQDNSLITSEQQYEISSHVIDLDVLTLAISEAMRHTVLGFDSPKTEAQGANNLDGAIFMRNSFSLGEADGASSDAPIPLSRSVNPSTSPTRLTAGCEYFNLTKDAIMQTNVGSLQPVRIQFNDLSLRVFNINNEPWFAVTDVCSGLKLTNPSKAITNLRDCERSNLKLERGGSLNIINESGLYTLILRCDSALKEGTPAFNFRVKVTDEILPSIRKKGFYSAQEQDNSLITPEQQYEISSHVMRKTHALFGQRNYSAVYRALKRRFRIPRYTCLLNRDYETALKFIDNLTADDFSLPDMPEEKVPATPVVLAKNAKFVTQACKFSFNAFSTCEKSLAAVPAIPAIPAPASYSITESELRAIKAMVYYFEVLFKPLIQWAEHEAFKQNHPLASRFYDVWHEPQWFLGRMKRIIERNNA